MSRKTIKWIAGSGLIGGLTFLSAASYMLRPAVIKRVVVDGLERHLNLDTELDELSVSLLPRPNVSGSGLRLRLRHRADLPPFISIEHFSVNVGLLSVMRRHVDTVHADGLKIAIPPGEARQRLPGGDANGPDTEDRGGIQEIIVDHFVTHDAELRFIPRDKTKTPLVFAIHALDVYDVGFNRTMPFVARLTNPVPTGLVDAKGQIGPWNKADGLATRVSGDYTFTDANLATINGIGGLLNSTGKFGGRLTSIGATGTATIPDFSLDLGGKPMPLKAKFETIIDGSDGTVILEQVDAVMGSTIMHVKGAIRNLEGPGRHQVELETEVSDGRIEDVLALVIDSPQPIMMGDLVMHAKFVIPPGEERLRNRLTLEGTFGLASTTFTDTQVQSRLTELSRRSQGKDKDEAIARVMTNLHGQVRLQSGVASLRRLTFQVPGARIALDGTYTLSSEALDFRGELQMKASISQAVGGFKSIFIRPFNPLFRKNGSGAVIPIKIHGTRKAPKYGVEMGKIF